MKRALIIIGLFFSLSSTAFAQGAGGDAKSPGIGLDPNLFPTGLATENQQDPTKAKQTTADSIRIYVTQHFVEVILGITATVALYFILNNGFWMIASAGGEKIDEAKKGLTWAIIGMILIILSYSIIRFIISIPLSADEEVNTPAAAETR